jgi:hypothetical protein
MTERSPYSDAGPAIEDCAEAAGGRKARVCHVVYHRGSPALHERRRQTEHCYFRRGHHLIFGRSLNTFLAGFAVCRPDSTRLARSILDLFTVLVKSCFPLPALQLVWP